MRLVRVHFPGIVRACTEISYDNGGINRYRSERQMLAELGRFLDRHPLSECDLRPIDDWLFALSFDDLMTVCCGEQDEMSALTKNAPPHTNELLKDFFEQVC